MSNILVPYVETKGEEMVYSQLNHSEFTGLYDLMKDANKEIIKREKIIRLFEQQTSEMYLELEHEGHMIETFGYCKHEDHCTKCKVIKLQLEIDKLKEESDE